MAELTKAQQAHVDMIAAYDDRNRLFENLRNPKLNDEERKAAQDEWRAAHRKFNELRDAAMK